MYRPTSRIAPRPASRRTRPAARSGAGPEAGPEAGFALFTVLVLTIIAALVLGASMRTAEFGERLSGSSIERNRAFNAAEGGLTFGERTVPGTSQTRTFASSDGADGTFSFGALGEEPSWWQDADFDGATSVIDTFVGVRNDPEHVVEEIGDYVADGGSGIVSLDRGAAGYGRKTGSGREVVLYRVQSRGTGSSAKVSAVVESLVVRPQ